MDSLTRLLHMMVAVRHFLPVFFTIQRSVVALVALTFDIRERGPQRRRCWKARVRSYNTLVATGHGTVGVGRLKCAQL